MGLISVSVLQGHLDMWGKVQFIEEINTGCCLGGEQYCDLSTF